MALGERARVPAESKEPGAARANVGHMTSRLTDAEIAVISARASVTTTTVYRRLLGLPVRGRAGERCDRAIAELGIARVEVFVCEEPVRPEACS